MFKQFFKLESASGIILCFAALFALALENSPFSYLYDLIFNAQFVIKLNSWSLDKPLLLWINDGLMAIFFLLISLEIKRELFEGSLSSRSGILLPTIAAIGGLVGPAIFYMFFNWHNAAAMRGWAIPVATDIAFALGILSLFGNRVPKSLKIILTAIAILDDLAAIGIIAIYYTDSLSWLSIILAGISILVLILLNKRNVQILMPYILVGMFLWVCVLKSGVHATLAGVILGFAIPMHNRDKESPSLLKRLEAELHPYVAYGILPLFAFANAGVPLTGISLNMLLEPITLGIILGLMLGAPIGVCLFTAAGVLFKVIKIPQSVSTLHYVGMAMLTGIGFTMSLFISSLSFNNIELINAARLGILIGSLGSIILGCSLLWLTQQRTESSRLHS